MQSIIYFFGGGEGGKDRKKIHKEKKIRKICAKY